MTSITASTVWVAGAQNHDETRNTAAHRSPARVRGLRSGAVATTADKRLPLVLCTRAALGAPAAVAAWALLVLAGHLLGQRLLDADYRVHIGAPPLVGGFDARLTARLLGAVAFAGAALAWAPVLAARLSWRRLLLLAWLAAGAWAVLLALGDGAGGLSAPLTSRYEYLAAVARVGSPLPFLQSFTTDLPLYPTHVKGHPPGMVLALWGLARAGLGGPGPATALILGLGALTAPAALVAVRATAGERPARAAAPYLALAPGAVWVATSADALFAGVAACGIACLAVALHATPRRPLLVALAGGLLLGCALLLSYGAAPIGAVALALAWTARTRPRTAARLAVAAGGVAAVVLAFGLAGFWWWDGLRATRELYYAGVTSRRPYLDFVVISLAAFALACGPAVFAALARLRTSPARIPVGLLAGVAVALAAADLSGMSRGETERIWLIFLPWVLCTTVVLKHRGWLAAQLALGLALQALVVSPW